MEPARNSQAKRRLRFLRTTAALVAVTVLAIAGHAFSLGLKHVSTASAYRLSSEYWANGEYSKAAGLFSLAVGMTWRGGVRSEVANVHLARVRRLQDAGDLEGALRECANAVRALGMYDDEGATSYLCFQIETQLASQAP